MPKIILEEGSLVDEIPNYREWIEHAEGSSFFGKMLSEMSREEVLGVVGFLAKESERREKQIKQERTFLLDLERVRRR